MDVRIGQLYLFFDKLPTCVLSAILFFVGHLCGERSILGELYEVWKCLEYLIYLFQSELKLSLGSGLQSSQTTGTTRSVCTLLEWGMDTLGMTCHAKSVSTLLVLQVINHLSIMIY